jgi:hypothetical protein
MLKLWLKLAASGSTEMFPTLFSFGADKTLRSAIEEHLIAFKKSLKNTLEVLSKIWTGFVTA